MSILDLIENTVEGATQVALSPVKATIGIATLVLDEGETIAQAADDLVEGAQKIGNPDKGCDGASPSS